MTAIDQAVLEANATLPPNWSIGLRIERRFNLRNRYTVLAYQERHGCEGLAGSRAARGIRTMNTQRDWLTDIGAAADELGYGILVLEPGRIELADIAPNSKRGVKLVVIESVFLSADLLRRVLREVTAP